MPAEWSALFVLRSSLERSGRQMNSNFHKASIQRLLTSRTCFYSKTHFPIHFYTKPTIGSSRWYSTVTMSSPSRDPRSLFELISSFPTMLDTDFHTLLRSYGKFKARSHETHESEHVPKFKQLLNDHAETGRCEPLSILLLGDSMFQRLLTTGKRTILGPEHPTRLPEEALLNAGVGGDRVANIVYRLTMASTEIPGLFSLLQRAGGARYVFLMMGANDLEGDRHAISDHAVAAYACVVESMHRIRQQQNVVASSGSVDANADVTVVVCGLTARRRVKKGSESIIRESNDKLERMVQLFHDSRDREKDPADAEFVVEFLPSDPAIIDHLEDDGVHLNERGYEIFAADIWQKYEELVERDRKRGKPKGEHI